MEGKNEFPRDAITTTKYNVCNVDMLLLESVPMKYQGIDASHATELEYAANTSVINQTACHVKEQIYADMKYCADFAVNATGRICVPVAYSHT